MLQVECEKCKEKFWVAGYTAPDSWINPGEVVTELECLSTLCPCLQDGEAFTVVDECVAFITSLLAHRAGSANGCGYRLRPLDT